MPYDVERNFNAAVGRVPSLSCGRGFYQSEETQQGFVNLATYRSDFYQLGIQMADPV